MIVKEKREKANEVAEKVKEVYGENNIVTVLHSRKFKGMPDFVMLFQAINVALSKELKPASCKVLLYFLGKTAYGNYIGIDQQTIMEELDLSKPTVVNSIKQLEQLNILISMKDLIDKRRNVYILNPHSAWKGTFKERFAAIKKLGDGGQLQLPLTT